MIRNTSAISWIPILLIKAIKDRAFCNMVISVVFVALPVLAGIVFLDTYFYNFD